MPLEPCRECQQDISGDATTCPHCGVSHPTEAQLKVKKMGTILAWVFVGSILLFFLGIPIIIFGWPFIVAGLIIYGVVRLVRFVKARQALVNDKPQSTPPSGDGS